MNDQPNVPGVGDPDSGRDRWVPPGPREWHVPGYNYVGPGTDLDSRAGVLPVDEVDAAAREHDLAYLEIERDIANGLISKEEARLLIRKADVEFGQRAGASRTSIGALSQIFMSLKAKFEDLGLLSPERFTNLTKRKRVNVPDMIGVGMEEAALPKRTRFNAALQPPKQPSPKRYRTVVSQAYMDEMNQRYGKKGKHHSSSRRSSPYPAKRSVIREWDLAYHWHAPPRFVRVSVPDRGVGVRHAGPLFARASVRKQSTQAMLNDLLHGRTPCAEKAFRKRKWRRGFRVKRKFCKRRKCT